MKIASHAGRVGKMRRFSREEREKGIVQREEERKKGWKQETPSLIWGTYLNFTSMVEGGG